MTYEYLFLQKLDGAAVLGQVMLRALPAEIQTIQCAKLLEKMSTLDVSSYIILYEVPSMWPVCVI